MHENAAGRRVRAAAQSNSKISRRTMNHFSEPENAALATVLCWLVNFVLVGVTEFVTGPFCLSQTILICCLSPVTVAYAWLQVAGGGRPLVGLLSLH